MVSEKRQAEVIVTPGMIEAGVAACRAALDPAVEITLLRAEVERVYRAMESHRPK